MSNTFPLKGNMAKRFILEKAGDPRILIYKDYTDCGL